MTTPPDDMKHRAHPAAAASQGDAGHGSIVVLGHLGSHRSDVGFRLARRLHRPCVDVDSDHLLDFGHRPLEVCGNAERAAAERSRFEAFTGSGSLHVIVGSCSVIDLVPAARECTALWVAWLDIERDALLETLRASQPDLDESTLDAHLAATEPSASTVDARVATSGRTIEELVDRLADEYHHATETTT